jgi:trk system potassium uptake protein TrkH
MNDSTPTLRERLHRLWRWLLSPARGSGLHLPAALRLVAGLALFVLIGALLLLLPGVTTRPISLSDAFFTATSAVIVTGLSVVTTSTDFTFFGQIILLLLIQIGGLGFMAMVVMMIQLLGQKVSLANRLALTKAMGLENSGSILEILTRSILYVLAVEALGAVLLFIYWSIRGIVSPDKIFFYSIFHAVSAFCNAGFDLFAGTPQYPDGIPNDNGTLLILGTLVVLGGLGIPVVMDLSSPGKRLSLHSRITIVAAISLTLAGWVGLFVAERSQGGVVADAPLASSLVQTWFQSVSTRTAGFPGLDSFNRVGAASRLLIVSLMFIGSGPASMGGGVSTGTFAVLGLAVWNVARGSSRVQVFKRTIPDATVRRAAVVMVTALGTVLVASWLILITSRFSFNTVLFEVISALATSGLSMGITDQLNPFGRLVIMSMMFFGRLGTVTIMIALFQRRYARKRLRYPEESILI